MNNENILPNIKLRQYVLYYKFLIEYLLNDDSPLVEKNELLINKLKNTPNLVQEYSIDFLVENASRLNNYDDVKKLETIQSLSKSMKEYILFIATIEFEGGVVDAMNHYGYLKSPLYV